MGPIRQSTIRQSTIRRSLACVALAALVVAPAAAEIYTVELANGNTIQSRYQPRAAPWDEGLVLILTEVGNEIAVSRADVVGIASDIETKGYGTRISTSTVALGWAPNDAPVPGEDAAPSAQERLLRLLESQNQPRPDYSVQQFAEPSEAGGIPVWMTGATTPPLGAGAGSGGAAPDLSGIEPPQR